MELKLNIQKNSRLIGIDYVKGVLIFFMVVAHAGCPDWMHDAIYLFHMPCFFIISGFLFSEKYLTRVKEFVQKRFRSLWWPYVLWTCVFVLFHNIFTYFHFHTSIYSIRETMAHIVWTFVMMWEEQMGGTFWFLKALLFASFASLLWYKIFGFSKVSKIVGVCLALLLALFLKFVGLSYYYVTDLNVFALTYFMLGVSVKDVITKKVSGISTATWICVLFLNIICITGGDMANFYG